MAVLVFVVAGLDVVVFVLLVVIVAVDVVAVVVVDVEVGPAVGNRVVGMIVGDTAVAVSGASSTSCGMSTRALSPSPIAAAML